MTVAVVSPANHNGIGRLHHSYLPLQFVCWPEIVVI